MEKGAVTSGCQNVIVVIVKRFIGLLIVVFVCCFVNARNARVLFLLSQRTSCGWLQSSGR